MAKQKKTNENLGAQSIKKIIEERKTQMKALKKILNKIDSTK